MPASWGAFPGTSSSGISTQQRRAALKIRNSGGFTLIEILIVVALVLTLTLIAYPSYTNHVIKSNRTAAQAELLELSSLEEKIYLNSNAYSTSLTAAYTGQAAGGLGRTSA